LVYDHGESGHHFSRQNVLNSCDDDTSLETYCDPVRNTNTTAYLYQYEFDVFDASPTRLPPYALIGRWIDNEWDCLQDTAFCMRRYKIKEYNSDT
jgi:hypothetical protein